MPRVRAKVWWYMVAVAAVALAIPPLRAWWSWHQEMLWWSDRCHKTAAAVAKSGIRPWMTHVLFTHGRANGTVQRVPISEIEAFVKDYGRAATFPWFGEPPARETRPSGPGVPPN